MISRRWTLFSIALVPLAACSMGTENDSNDLAVASQSLTASGSVLGFESTSAWALNAGTATVATSTDHVEGSVSLAVSNINNYASLRSDATSAPTSVGSEVTLQIKLPIAQPNPSWYGQVQLFVDSPSRGLYSQPIGQAALTGLPVGTFRTLHFAIPTSIKTALLSGTVSDVHYEVHLNVPSKGVYLLDGLSFGAVDVPAPLGLKAYTGGGDIALLWKAMSWSRTTVRYNVIRNGTNIGTALPTLARFSGAIEFADPNVVNGQTYSYQVQAVADDGSLSGLSSPISITHSTAGVPVPTVTVDSSVAPDIATYLNLGKAAIQTWYPKIANMIAYPDYVPSSVLTIRAFAEDTTHTCAGAGWVGDGEPTVLKICATWARGVGVPENDQSVFIHESTHIIQTYTLGEQPGAVVEGIASWAGDLGTGYEQSLPPATATFLDGYGTAEYFFNWISRTYAKPNFVHDLNVLTKLGNYSDDWYRVYTGRTIAQLWTEMTGVSISMPGPLKNAAGKCADLTLYRTDNGTPIEILGCYATGAQKFVYGPIANGVALLHLVGKCIGTDASGAVVLSDCTSATTQLWQFRNGAVVNAGTNQCLQATGGSNTDGTPLVTTTCDGSSAQSWAPLQN